MSEEFHDIKVAGGICDSFLVVPEGDGPWPAAVMYADATGVSPYYYIMARRMAANGYVTLLPNILFRAGRVEKLLADDPDTRLHNYLKMDLTRTQVAEDAEGLLDFLQKRPEVAGDKVGFTGFCLGGSCAVTVAARHPDRVSTALSFHGARFHYDKPDSVHLVAGKIACPIFLGIAAKDPYLVPGETERFKDCLDEFGTDYRMEVFPNSGHGFAILGADYYDRASYERSWARELEYFGDNM